jgi:hypothetical protein
LDSRNGIETEGGCRVWSLAGHDEEGSEGFEDRDRLCLAELGLSFLNTELGWTRGGWEEPEGLLGRVLEGEGVELLDVWVGRISREEVGEGDLRRTSGALLEAGWDCELWEEV